MGKPKTLCEVFAEEEAAENSIPTPMQIESRKRAIPAGWFHNSELINVLAAGAATSFSYAAQPVEFRSMYEAACAEITRRILQSRE